MGDGTRANETTSRRLSSCGIGENSLTCVPARFKNLTDEIQAMRSRLIQESDKQCPAIAMTQREDSSSSVTLRALPWALVVSNHRPPPCKGEDDESPTSEDPENPSSDGDNDYMHCDGFVRLCTPCVARMWHEIRSQREALTANHVSPGPKLPTPSQAPRSRGSKTYAPCLLPPLLSATRRPDLSDAMSERLRRTEALIASDAVEERDP